LVIYNGRDDFPRDEGGFTGVAVGLEVVLAAFSKTTAER